MLKTKRYSSIQITLPCYLSESIIDWGKLHILDNDIYQNNEGRENDPHITILRGIRRSDAQKVRYAIANEKPFEVMLKSMGIFESDKFDVIKINVECAALYELHELLKEKFTHTQMFPVYSPHVTIAYVKKGRCKNLDNNLTFNYSPFPVKQITYCDKSGEKSFLTLRGT